MRAKERARGEDEARVNKGVVDAGKVTCDTVTGEIDIRGFEGEFGRVSCWKQDGDAKKGGIMCDVLRGGVPIVGIW